jgi:hypothetical protein
MATSLQKQTVLEVACASFTGATHTESHHFLLIRSSSLGPALPIHGLNKTIVYLMVDFLQKDVAPVWHRTFAKPDYH